MTYAHPMLEKLEAVRQFATDRMLEDRPLETWYRARKLADATDDMMQELQDSEDDGEADRDGPWTINEALSRLAFMVPFNDDTIGLAHPIPDAMRPVLSEDLSLAVTDALKMLPEVPGVTHRIHRLKPLDAIDIALKWAREQEHVQLSSVLMHLRAYYAGETARRG